MVLWQLEYGQYVDRFKKIEEETGETPAVLESRPPLHLASHALLFEAFMMMHMMRTSNGFGPNPITMGMIKEYLDLFGSPPVDLDIFVKMMKRLDEAALKWLREQDEKKTAAAKAKASSGAS